MTHQILSRALLKMSRECQLLKTRENTTNFRHVSVNSQPNLHILHLDNLTLCKLQLITCNVINARYYSYHQSLHVSSYLKTLEYLSIYSNIAGQYQQTLCFNRHSCSKDLFSPWDSERELILFVHSDTYIFLRLIIQNMLHHISFDSLKNMIQKYPI